MELKQRLGKRIQELRHWKKLKQSELAEKVGIATKTQSCIETGKNYPSADLIERYARVFNIDVSEVLNVGHIKNSSELKSEIISIISAVDESQISKIYRVIKGIVC